MLTWNAERIVSNDDLTTRLNIRSDLVGNITVRPYVVTNRTTAETAESITQRNHSFTISAEDARNHILTRSALDRDGDEALSEYYLDERYSDLLREYYERTRPHPNAVVGRSNTSVSGSDLLSKDKIKELIREVLIEEGIILNKPQEAIAEEEVDELFEQRGINEEC